MANFYAHQQIVEKRITSVNQIFEKIDMVTAEDVQRVAKKYFNVKNVCLMIKGPLGHFNKNSIQKLINKYLD